MRTIYTEFKCDECNSKERVEADNSGSFQTPYKKGWIVLDIGLKLSNMDKKEVNKHFCCKKCLTLFIEKMMEE